MSLPSHPIVSGTITVIPMVGHPVRQVHMPGVIDARFRDYGIDAVMMPMDIVPGALSHSAALLRATSNSRRRHNFLAQGGMAGLADRLKPRAQLLGARHGQAAG